MRCVRTAGRTRQTCRGLLKSRYEAPARQQPNCDLYHCEFPSAMLGVSHHHFKRAGCGLLKSVEQLRISRNYVCAFFRTNTDGTELNGVPVSVCSV
jgi:hypothetical protein